MPSGADTVAEAHRQAGKWLWVLAGAFILAVSLFVFVLTATLFLEHRIETSIKTNSPWSRDRGAVIQRLSTLEKRLESIESQTKLAEENARQLKQNRAQIDRLEKMILALGERV